MRASKEAYELDCSLLKFFIPTNLRARRSFEELFPSISLYNGLLDESLSFEEPLYDETDCSGDAVVMKSIKLLFDDEEDFSSAVCISECRVAGDRA